MIVWVTGAQGMLGRAVSTELTARGYEHVGTDRDVDLGDPAAVNAFGASTRFTHVINCAAYTGVDACEAHEADAHRVNADGAGNLARVARVRKARAIHVSTDYVFDGAATTPYAADAATGPLNAYGRTKLAGEQRFLAELPDGVLVRTSWLFGHGGACFPATMLRVLGLKPEVKVVDDQTGRPTYTGDLAMAIVSLLVHEHAPTGTFHFANAGAITWYGFAMAIREAAAQRGRHYDATLLPITTAEYPLPARRPAYSVLDTSKLEALGITPRPWREALADYLEVGWP